jgi:hypothetical protein
VANSLTCTQIWLILLVDDRQCGYMTKLTQNKNQNQNNNFFLNLKNLKIDLIYYYYYYLKTLPGHTMGSNKSQKRMSKG